MDGFREAGGRARAALALFAATATLAACAGPTPRYAIRDAGHGESRQDDGAPPSRGLHGTDKPYEIGGRWYYPKAQPDYDQVGLASWYGAAEHNHHTANGEIFDQYGLSAAHKTLPLPSIVEVTNLANGKKLRVRLNDRGPFVDGRLIDLSRGAAEKLGFDRQGVAKVRVRYIGAAPPLAVDGLMQAQLSPRHAVIAPPTPAPVLSAAPASVEAAADEPEATEESDYRVQIGAYASRTDATRAAAQLGDGVRYMIEPVERQGGSQYRVVLGGFLDEDDALAAQLRYNAAGFSDARVLKPF
jgi:rare lipoprotein A